MIRARERLPAYIADAEEMERRIGQVQREYDALLQAGDGYEDEANGLAVALRFLRGEP